MRRAAALGALLSACATPQDDAAQGKDSGEAPRQCNGHAALCDRPFDQLTLPGTHNSMSAADEGWLGPNQQHGIERQLEDGVRGLMLDTYEEEGELLLCHSACSLGSRPLVDALLGVAAFLDAHPDDLIVIIFQDGVPTERTAWALEAAGLSGRALTTLPAAGAAWPTLGALTEEGVQLVIGMEFSGPPPAAQHHAWDLYQDTPYSFNSAEEFSCAANRGGPDSPLLLVNHWIGPIPSEDRAAEVNAAEVLRARAEACAAERGLPVHFLGVDHYAVGDLFAVADALNGVSDEAR